MRSYEIAGLLLRLAARLGPPGWRREWLDEWRAELRALEERRSGAGTPEAETTRTDAPHPVAFAAGAITHALRTWTEEWTMDLVWQDLRYAVRVLARSPAFTAVAAVTLALGIGANAAVFSLVNGILLRPPSGIQEPDRLVQIARSYDDAPRWDNWSLPALELIDREADVLDGVAGYQDQAFVLGRGEDAERVIGQLVTGDYFRVLGVRPWLGRTLLPSDDVTPGAHPVAVLSHRLWSRRFGGDPAVVGRTVEIGSDPVEVVGVAPPDFAGPDALGTPPSLWMPTMQHAGRGGRTPFGEWGWSWIEGVGRLAEGVDVTEARAAMDVVTARLREADPSSPEIRVLLAPGVGLDPEGRREARQLSFLLMGVVGLVLLLACTNVANLFLARSHARRSEMGVRIALGAGRRRLGVQILVESLVLAGAAALLALPVVRLAGTFLPALFPYTLSVSLEPDGRVYLFLATVAVLAGFLFGVVPAWLAGGRDVSRALRSAASGEGAGATRLRDALVVIQLGISLALVTSAGLLGRSILNARSAEPGFRPTGLWVSFLDLSVTGRYDDESGPALLRRLVDDLRGRPGVEAAAVADLAPIAGGHARAGIYPADRPDAEPLEAEAVVVGSGYFETLGVEVVEGRVLEPSGPEPERVVVVNERLAELYWPGESAVGKRILRGEEWRVVGVAADVRMRSIRAPALPAVYYPMSHSPPLFATLHVRMAEGMSGVPDLLRRTVADHDPGIPVNRPVHLRDAVTDSLGETRTVAWLVAVLGGMALVLAAVGLYGLVSFGVTQRVRELGIRKALGSAPSDLVALVLRRSLALALVGLIVGVGVTVVTGRALEDLLFGVEPMDVATLTGAASVLLGAALVAAWIPARRASRVDPVDSLRE